jgi:anaphase-promoting complex subunit 8
LPHREKKEEARQVLAASVSAYPCNWSAWLALQSVCGDMAAAAAAPLPDHFMRRFFLASLAVDTHHNADALQHLQVCVCVYVCISVNGVVLWAWAWGLGSGM